MIPLILEAKAEFKKIFHSFFWFKWEQENLFRGHTFKMSANFHDFWPLSPSCRQFFYYHLLFSNLANFWPLTPVTPKKCQRLKFDKKLISPQAGCRFECMLQNAYDTCKCTPWNFPYIETGEMEICDMFGRLKDISTSSYSPPISTSYFSIIVNSSTTDFLTRG